MRINHNIAALNTHRQLGSANNAQGKSMEKLSSGLRINRAGDDAAGLAISEKMRGQIRGLDQASSNAQDGISMLQTAEGALNETHSILQRMRELAVQSSNGTLEDQDREAIQAEVDQLTKEIDRIAETTQFNQKKLLRGTPEGRAFAKVDSSAITYDNVNGNEWEGIVNASPNSKASIDIELSSAIGATDKTDAITALDGKTFTINNKTYELTFNDGTNDSVSSGNIAVNINDSWTDGSGTNDANAATNMNYVIDQLVNAITANDSTVVATKSTPAADSDTTDNGTGVTAGILTISSAENMAQPDADSITVEIGTTADSDAGISGIDLKNPTDSSSIGNSGSLVASTDGTSEEFGITFSSVPKAGDTIKIDDLTISFVDNGDVGFNYSGGGSTASIDVSNRSISEVLEQIESVLDDANTHHDSNPTEDALSALSSHSVVGNTLVLSTTKTDDGQSFGDSNTNGLDIQIMDGDFEANAGQSLKLDMQIGSNESEKMEVEFGVMDSASLRLAFNADRSTAIPTAGTNAIAGIDVSSSTTKAQGAITAIDKAIKAVSEERSKLGAYQNRLEHTINNLNTASENLTAAESRIRDVDYALVA
ncbi:flagellin N-terminal helical domain-containing protein [Solibacillus isronensis]|uniref:flagellin N-terminal helical domain-containing protein n=1 Tax=Solibacillus isronensis TaxID=412383 RepID=UPI0009A77B80|nr:flagellin [Solibacillus isronensis]